MQRSAAILAVVGLLATVDAEPNEHGVDFLFPVAGLTLNYLDTVNVTYTSPFPNPLLYTFCTNKTDTSRLIQKELIKATPYNASHLVTLNYKDVDACYWNLRPNTSTGYGANSPSVKLLTDGRSSTTIGLLSETQPPNTSSSGTPAPTSAPTSAQTSGPTGAPADSSGANTNPGLSTGAKAGIGAGIAVVAVVIIAGLVFWLLKKRRNRRNANETAKVSGIAESGSELPGHGIGDYSDDGPGKVRGYHDYEQHQKSSTVGELPGKDAPPSGQVYEMSGESRPVEAAGEAVKK